MSAQLSNEEELIKRSCAIFAYIFDPRVTPYPSTICEDPKYQFEEPNIPDFEESLNDYFLREVHNQDIEAREPVLQKLSTGEQKLVDQLENTQIKKDSIQIGERIAQRTASGVTASEEARKRRLETDLKRKEATERRRREALERKQRMKEAEIKKLREQIKEELRYKKDLKDKEEEERKVYGKFRANELMRLKEEREKKKVEEKRKEEEAKKMLKSLEFKSSLPPEDANNFKHIQHNEHQKALEKSQRMKEISTTIYQDNQKRISQSPRKSPRSVNKFSFK